MERILNKFKHSKIVNAFIVTLFGSGLSKIILVLATFVTTNMLTKMEFGELSFIRNTLNTILCICALNFQGLCTKFTTESLVTNKSLQKLFWLILFSLSACLVFGLLLVILPERVLLSIFKTKIVLVCIKIVGVFLPLFMLQPIIEGVLKGLQKFKEIGYIQVASSLFYLIVIYIGIKLGRLSGALAAVMIYYGSYSLLCLAVLMRYVNIKKTIPKLKGFTTQFAAVPNMILPVFLMSFIEAPSMWLAQVILSHAGSMESVGSMSALMQIRNLATLIPSYFIGTFVAFACEINANNNYIEYFKKFEKVKVNYLIIGLGLFLALSIFSKFILRLYGPGYVDDYYGCVIANFGIPIIMCLSLFRVNMVIQEHQKHLLNISIIWNCLWLVLLYLLIKVQVPPLYSFFISYNLSNIVGLIYMYIFYKKDKLRLTLKL